MSNFGFLLSLPTGAEYVITEVTGVVRPTEMFDITGYCSQTIAGFEIERIAFDATFRAGRRIIDHPIFQTPGIEVTCEEMRAWHSIFPEGQIEDCWVSDIWLLERGYHLENLPHPHSAGS